MIFFKKLERINNSTFRICGRFCLLVTFNNGHNLNMFMIFHKFQLWTKFEVAYDFFVSFGED